MSELREMRQLKEENARLKQMVADLSLGGQMLRCDQKKALKPAQKKELAGYLMEQYKVGYDVFAGYWSFAIRYFTIAIIEAKTGH